MSGLPVAHTKVRPRTKRRRGLLLLHLWTGVQREVSGKSFRERANCVSCSMTWVHPSFFMKPWFQTLTLQMAASLIISKIQDLNESKINAKPSYKKVSLSTDWPKR